MKIFSLIINKKSKIFQNIFIILILSILSYFLVFSKTNFEITSNIVSIFISIVIPSLFPFILFGNILIYSNYFNLLVNSSINKIIKLYFKTSNYGASAIIFGFLFGYPNGARYVNELYENKKIGFKEAEYLLMFVNNSSPAFILSSIGVGLFHNIRIGILLLASHITSSIIIGKIFSYRYKLKEEKRNSFITSQEGETLLNYNISFETITKSIIKSIYTMCMIFGFMVIFILAYNYMLNTLSYIVKPNKLISAFMLAIAELTSGLNNLIALPINLKTLVILISFFLGFSSLSINFQIFSCVHKNEFKLKSIIKGKLLHGILSAIITYILINITKIYEYINIAKKVNYNIQEFNYSNILNNSTIISLIVFTFHLFIFLFIIKKKRLKNRFFKKGDNVLI